MTATEELAELVQALPEAKARSVLDFARYLAEQADDEAWEQSLEAARSSPRFRQLVADVERQVAAGEDEPMDFDRL